MTYIASELINTSSAAFALFDFLPATGVFLEKIG